MGGEKKTLRVGWRGACRGRDRVGGLLSDSFCASSLLAGASRWSLVDCRRWTDILSKSRELKRMLTSRGVGRRARCGRRWFSSRSDPSWAAAGREQPSEGYEFACWSWCPAQRGPRRGHLGPQRRGRGGQSGEGRWGGGGIGIGDTRGAVLFSNTIPTSIHPGLQR